MLSFVVSKPEPLPFSKEQVQGEITDFLSRQALWRVFMDPVDDLDLLLIRSLDIAQEISIQSNPNSDYRKVVPRRYQEIIGCHISDPQNLEKDRGDRLKEKHQSWIKEIWLVSSLHQFRCALEHHGKD
jgi:hypothetical protein